VTAGAGNDSMVDSPTAYGTDTGVGGEVRGNYCTLNPLTKPSSATISNGNLDTTLSTSSGSRSVASTFYQNTGSWYWEAVATTVGNNSAGIGIANTSFVVGNEGGTGCYFYLSDGRKVINNTYSSYGASWIANDVIGVAFDATNGTITFYKNGSSQGQITGIPTGVLYTPFVCSNTSVTASVFVNNFGQRAFAYTAPSGFKALCTQNLPTPTIGATSTTQANDYFDISLYTGNGTSQSITGLGFQPDFIWFKGRNTVTNHAALDAVRGRSKILFPSLPDAEATSSTTSNDLVSFNANGFSVGIPEQSGSINTNGTNVVAWCWNAGGSTVTNTSGTISAQVRANTTSGFSIATYTGNGSSSQTVGHGLGVTPGMVIIKTRSNSDNWRVWHTSLTSGQTLTLNSTAAQAASGFWPSSPSTSVVYLGTDSSVNSSTWTYVMYSFAPVAGYSAFGSYTGNGSTDGTFVYTGFRPEFVMIKGSSVITNWTIVDAARNTYNVATLNLRPNTTAAETTDIDFDLLSNGFKLRGSGSGGNNSGSTYIYMAFAENPFKYSLAR
jgi:hypothetical protein